jgi:hypothetical protein
VRGRSRALVVTVVAAVALSAAAGFLLATRDGHDEDQANALIPARTAASSSTKAIHGLLSGNLRVLTPAETRRLLAYASAVESPLAAHGVAASGPTTEARTITLETANEVGVRQLVDLVTGCAVDAPPSPSSLQVVDARTVVLSVAKQCLLDPKVEARKTGV